MQSSVHADAGARRAWRINFALFLAGFSTFSLLYCVQPLLPRFAQQFKIGATESSLVMSLTTGFLAMAILCAGALSEGRNRKWLMFGSMAIAAVCNGVGALSGDWYALLLARALVGLVLGGVPAVALAYLADEIDSRNLGLSVGLYVSGTAFGGMAGRVGTGIAAEMLPWEWVLAGLSAIDLLAALGFLALLPAPRGAKLFERLSLVEHLRIWSAHMSSRGLALLFTLGFLSTGVFVSVYNYAGFRFLAAPFSLSETQASLIFCAYVFGMAASWLAGGRADRHGAGSVLVSGILASLAGIVLTMVPSLLAAICGIVMLTIGFFMTHSTASAWVGRLAGRYKGHAASLYLLAYYMGSSIVGSASGWFWEHGNWNALCTFALVALGIMLVCAVLLQSGARREILTTSFVRRTSDQPNAN